MLNPSDTVAYMCIYLFTDNYIMVNHDNLIIEELSIKDSNLIGYKFLTVT